MTRFLLAACAAVAIVATLGTPPAEAGPLRRLICGDRGSCGGGGDDGSARGPIRKLFHRFHGSGGGCSSYMASVDGTDQFAAIEMPVQSTLTIPQSMPSPAVTSSGIAQVKAETQARLGVMHHPGGSFGSGTHEGVGFSPHSADDAVKQCCYWGEREPLEIGVARGSRGWFACVIYR